MDGGGGRALCREPFSVEQPFTAAEELLPMLLHQDWGTSAFRRPPLKRLKSQRDAFGGANASVTPPLSSSRTHSGDVDPWSEVSGAGR